ncbi:MAG: hypothetical protein ACKOW9_03500 [Candidatus Paceibacterota bacterium]
MSEFRSWSPAPLGALRSELDEGSDLQNEFILLESYSQAVRHAFITGKIEASAAAGILSALRLKGSDGYFWSIGATTGSWYKKVGDSWIQTPPPYGVKVVEEGGYDWLRTGVASELGKAEAILKEKIQNKQASGNKVVSAGEGGSSATSAAGSNFESTSKEDLDWVLQEWGLLPRSSDLLNGQSANTGIVTTPDWNPDLAIENDLNIITNGAPRVSERVDSRSNSDGQESFDASMPQDFFLPPDDDK